MPKAKAATDGQKPAEPVKRRGRKKTVVIHRQTRAEKMIEEAARRDGFAEGPIALAAWSSGDFILIDKTILDTSIGDLYIRLSRVRAADRSLELEK